MGANMARRLRERGQEVTAVYDRDRTAAAALAAETGARAADRLADVTAAAEIVFTVVSDDAAMREIFKPGDDSLLHGAAGRTFINCATISPGVHQELETLAGRAGATSLEACMAGSIPQARNGTLFLMCGGDENVFTAHRTLLEHLGKVQYIGAAGRAAEVKALVNMLMNMNTAALAEALGLGTVLGFDSTMLQHVFAQTGAASRVLETDGADMVAREHEVYFSAAHAAKDSGIALALAQRHGMTLPLAAATKERYDEVVRRGFGELDKSVIAELTFPGRGAAAVR